MIIEFLVVTLFVLAAFNLWVTWRAIRDDLATLWQRIAHVGLIWLLPVLGGLIVLRLQRKDPEPHTGRYPGIPDAGDDFAVSGGSYRRMHSALDNSSGHSSPSD